MTATDPLRTFTAALPYRARQAFTLDYRTIPAIRACAERGDDLTRLAQRCAKGLERRTHADLARLIRYRLMRDAGLLTDDEKDDS